MKKNQKAIAKPTQKEKNIKISGLILQKECRPLPAQLHSFYQGAPTSVNLKKTTAKEPVQIIQHQKEMDKIANDMAVLFEKKINASKLAKWLTLANVYADDSIEITWGLGYEILPGLINAKTQDDRINFLKKNLLAAFGFDKSASNSVSQLCENYFKKNNGRSISAEGIEEFMNVCLTLFAICEKFDEYEYHRKEMKLAA
jgi:hypothetical protein